VSFGPYIVSLACILVLVQSFSFQVTVRNIISMLIRPFSYLDLLPTRSNVPSTTTTGERSFLPLTRLF
jgi:hypothetical protein